MRQWIALLLCLFCTSALAQANPPAGATGVIYVAGGTTVSTSIANASTDLNVIAGGPISTWTVNLPSVPFDGQQIRIACPAGSVTSLSVTASRGPTNVSLAPGAVPCAANSGTALTYQYSYTQNAWYLLAATSGSLTALPQPATNIVATEGDSRDGSVITYTPGVLSQEFDRRIPFWIKYLTNGVVQFPIPLDFAISGSTSTAMLARFPASLAGARSGGASAMFIVGGFTNDPGAGVTLAQSIANGNAIITLAQQAQMPLIWLGEMPRGNASQTTPILTGNLLQWHQGIDNWIAQQSQLYKNVYVIRIWQAMEDHTTVANAAAGYIRSALSYDGLHPNSLGAYTDTKVAAPIFSQLFSGFASPLIQSGADIFDATVRPLGALNPNPFMIGSGGTASTGCSGTVPANWTCKYNGNGSITAVSSIVTDASGKPFTKLVISGTAGTGFDTLTMANLVSGAGITPGALYTCSSEIKVDAGQTGVLAIENYLEKNTGGQTTFTATGSSQSTTDAIMTTDALDGVLVCDPQALPAGATDMNLRERVTFSPGATVSASVYFGAASVHPGTTVLPGAP